MCLKIRCDGESKKFCKIFWELNKATVFGCSRIYINPHVLRWVGVELELNSTSIHSNTCGLRSIRQRPNKASDGIRGWWWGRRGSVETWVTIHVESKVESKISNRVIST